jgi:hypothetical protein
MKKICLSLSLLFLCAGELAFAGSFNLDSTDLDCTSILQNNPQNNWGGAWDSPVGLLWIAGGWEAHFMSRWPTFPDSIGAILAAGNVIDSGYAGYVVSNVNGLGVGDTVGLSARVITTAGWFEGAGVGTVVEGATWDSAWAIGDCVSGCDSLDWTTDGGDYSATQETFGGHSPIVWFCGSHSAGDTIKFPLSAASLTDSLGGGAGLMLVPDTTIDGDAGSAAYGSFYSDRQAGASFEEYVPFIEVFYHASGGGPVQSFRRRLGVQ